ncbi:hypothetical protein [Roseateles amylovorans]|uniref:RloB domain-containing protein n=1 Tax=Roseateles amylovorans TaxID=2978473 RepID=A0ABY6AXX5_9BURK|nr:hypothetical protein [Roseateles amylovorans]UXH76609.1 hypothetical protein N4261_16355 [Roseateles amylovorans]
MMRRNPTRHSRRTALLVGEGQAEVELLSHLRSIYTSDRQGCQLTIRNARGHGAGHVVKHAIALKRQAAFDRTAVLLDTDTDWTPATRVLARRHAIRIFSCTPCLEAWVLGLIDEPIRHGWTTAQYKERFARRFDGPAHAPGLMGAQLPRAALDHAATRDAMLPQLIEWLTASEPTGAAS